MASDAEGTAQPQPSAEVSKKGAKKAEAKAKKEAEKLRRAAERAATEAAKNESSAAVDAAKDNYGEIRGDDKPPALNGKKISLKSLDKDDVEKTVVLRAWIQNGRIQRFVPFR